MTGIIIGAGSDAVHGIKTAQKMGHKVIAFDGNPTAEGLGHADHAVVLDIRSPQDIINELRDEKPEFIIPVPIGRYLTTAGFLADHYHIKGIGYEGSMLCTDKYKYHEILHKEGLRPVKCLNVPAGSCLHDHHIKYIKYPIIVKPRYGSGSRGVMIIKNHDELKEQMINQQPFEEDYVIEDIIKGKEYGIDAAVVDGNFNLVLLRSKLITPPPFCQCIAYANVIKNHDNNKLFDSVINYMSSAVKVLGIKNALIHADLMIDNNLNVCAVEISGRPSGHKLHDVFTPLSSGVDMIREFIHLSVNEPYSFKPIYNKSMAMRFFNFENCRVIQKPDIMELKERYDIIEYKCNINDEPLGSVKDGHSIMDRGYFILSGSDEQDALKKTQEIIDMFYLNLRPSECS